MVIRITNQMTANIMLTNSNSAMNKLYDIQRQVTSGKKFTTATESPFNAAQVVKMKTQLGQLENWKGNILDAKNELGMAYDSLSVMQENVQRVNDLTIRLANDGNSDETNLALISEIKERTKTISGLANNQYQGVYIFGGTNTENPPYTIDDNMNVVYNGTSETQNWERKTEIAQGEEISRNVLGKNILGDETSGFFATVKSINDIVEAPPIDARKINQLLGGLTDTVANISSSMALVSSNVNRLDATAAINETVATGLTAVRSSLEDTDVVEASTQLALQQVSMEATLKIGSKLLNGPSLLNYI